MGYEADLSYIFVNPTKLVFGAGGTKDVSIELEECGVSKALLVTDKILRESTDLPDRVRSALGDKCVGVYDDVPSDSGVDTVEKGTELARKNGADCLVSVGGGSVIDTAKGMAILLTEGGKLRDHQGVQNLSGKLIPHIVIPTTAGTGSEVTNAAVIKDHEGHRKLLFWDNHLMPDVAILDPEVTRTLPPFLTAATGMDALSHAVEGIHAEQRNPTSDANALHAIRLISRYLERAVKDGNDMLARGQMLIAASLGGLAFANSSVGLVHAMAHTVGAQFGVHHGLANSIFMPHVIRFNAEECADLYVPVAEALGIQTVGKSDEEAAEAAAQHIFDLAGRIGLKQRLGDADVPEDALAGLSDATLYDGAIVYNPRFAMDEELVLGVYKASF